ncbi:MAG: thiamine-phosphate kinase [Cystobacterineae bacterium]|nr:thiamine-phosphate kinase [Cystobacterineae bacterium]
MPQEFEKIKRFIAVFSVAPSPEGPGDDACLLSKKRGRLCLTTDATIEGIHFCRKHFSLGDIGHKALAANLSDLAAMGAAADFWLCALGLPSGFGMRGLKALAEGMLPLAQRHGLRLVGGNITASPVLSLTLSLGGWASKPLLRSTARPGDKLYVIGSLGEAAAGLFAMQHALRVPKRFLQAQRRPKPWLEAAQAAAPYARAAIDVSDGMLQDLGHICQASGIGARLEASALPIPAALKRCFPKQALRFALCGGEDYALLLAIPPQKAKVVEQQWRAQSCPFTCVGNFINSKGIWLDGRRVSAQGFQH